MTRRFMHGVAAAGFAASALVVAAPASAQALFDATDPDAIVAAAREHGSAVLEEDSIGNPMIRGRIEGVTYLIFFLECDERGEGCLNLQFYASWDTDSVPLEVVNDWNINRVYGEALINEYGEPTLEMTVIVSGGVSAEALDEAFFIWSSITAGFADEVVFPATDNQTAG